MAVGEGDGGGKPLGGDESGGSLGGVGVEFGAEVEDGDGVGAGVGDVEAGSVGGDGEVGGDGSGVGLAWQTGVIRAAECNTAVRQIDDGDGIAVGKGNVEAGLVGGEGQSGGVGAGVGGAGWRHERQPGEDFAGGEIEFSEGRGVPEGGEGAFAV